MIFQSKSHEKRYEALFVKKFHIYDNGLDSIAQCQLCLYSVSAHFIHFSHYFLVNIQPKFTEKTAQHKKIQYVLLRILNIFQTPKFDDVCANFIPLLDSATNGHLLEILKMYYTSNNRRCVIHVCVIVLLHVKGYLRYILIL